MGVPRFRLAATIPPVGRSLVHSPHSASPKVEREEDPTVRAPEGAEEQPLRWTDEGRRSSGVTDDVITARMREHKEDSGDGRDVRWVVQGGKTSERCLNELHRDESKLNIDEHLSYGRNTRCMRMVERIVNQVLISALPKSGTVSVGRLVLYLEAFRHCYSFAGIYLKLVMQHVPEKSGPTDIACFSAPSSDVRPMGQ